MRKAHGVEAYNDKKATLGVAFLSGYLALSLFRLFLGALLCAFFFEALLGFLLFGRFGLIHRFHTSPLSCHIIETNDALVNYLSSLVEFSTGSPFVTLPITKRAQSMQSVQKRNIP